MNINRLIYPGFWFGKTAEEDALEMARRGAGGFCIYGGTRRGVQDFIEKVRTASPLPHLFICADYEDGLGKWISGEEWILSNLAVGADGRADTAYQKGLALARQARSLGVDWIYAPVLDLCDEPQNPIVNTRSFGSNPQAVGMLGAALCRGLRDGGVLNSIKHFPGHGRTTQDSHLGLPVLPRTLQQLKQAELVPFGTALPEADSVMVGHLLFPALDENNPASLSRAVITELLKQQLGFKGLVLTDALCMKALGDEKQAALSALHAGAHILLAAQDSIALSDFLQKQEISPDEVAESARLQEALWDRASATPITGLSAADFNQNYAPHGAVYSGEKIFFRPGMRAAYLELGNEEDFVARPFLDTLQKAGVQIVPAGEKAEVLLAVSFSNYKAFKGRINLSAAEQSALSRAAREYPQSLWISFGSPFGTENIPALTAQLLLFSPARKAQICAAEILLGRQQAQGKLPF